MANDGESLLLKLKDIEGKVSGTIMRRALRAGAKICYAQMFADAPVQSGATRSLLKVKALKRSRNRVGMIVSVGMGWFKGSTFYAGFVEFGHKLGKRGYQLRDFRYVRRGYDSVTGEKVGGRVKITHRAGTVRREDNRAGVDGTHWMRNAFNKSEPAASEKIYQVLREGLAKFEEKGAS